MEVQANVDIVAAFLVVAEAREQAAGFSLASKVIKPQQPLLGRSILFIEDNAPAHISHCYSDCFKITDVIKILSPADSPDANVIELARPWMRAISQMTTMYLRRRKSSSDGEESNEKNWQSSKSTHRWTVYQRESFIKWNRKKIIILWVDFFVR